MVADGEGELARAYEALKRRLEAEGLFSPERKKKLPKLPRRVGIITSSTGAAVRDMLNVTGRRYPLADILLYPAAVQGAEAPPQLLTGIAYFNAMKNVDVIIMGRGGGSIEDLWAFNDEALVRAVAASEIPVISAVGHETDFTLCDFAADCRAPTPSAAAELAVPDRALIEAFITKNENRIGRAINSRLTTELDNLSRLEKIITLNSPSARLEKSRLLLDGLTTRIKNSSDGRIKESRGKLAELAARLRGADPLAILSRGYGAIEGDDGKMIVSVKELEIAQRVDIIMSDGKARAEIIEVSDDKKVKRKDEVS
jgi:exodeoxyribonuclease VII large subunit